jgi:hypothetical protein
MLLFHPWMISTSDYISRYLLVSFVYVLNLGLRLARFLSFFSVKLWINLKSLLLIVFELIGIILLILGSIKDYALIISY